MDLRAIGCTRASLDIWVQPGIRVPLRTRGARWMPGAPCA
jgi:hypothetical protein